MPIRLGNGNLIESIGSAKLAIDKLRSEREKLYKDLIARIDADIVACKSFIENNCKHHEDMVIYEYVYHEDEYGKSMESWTEYKFTCTICDKVGTVNVGNFNKGNLTIQDVLNGG